MPLARLDDRDATPLRDGDNLLGRAGAAVLITFAKVLRRLFRDFPVAPP